MPDTAKEAGLADIRLAQDKDLPVLLQQQAARKSPYPSDDSVRRWVAGSHFSVATDEEQIVGWLALEYTFFERGFVAMLWVAEFHRRRGIGSTLLEHARAICETDQLWTSTNQSNLPMRALLRKQGWKFSGTLEHLDPGDPELFYVRTAGN